MNKYLKMFLHRGLIFGGFGPIIVSIVYLCLQNTIENFSLSGTDVCVAIVSTYLLAFIHAGASVFNGIEHWGLAKSVGLHFSALYIAYALCYLVNSWIPRSATGFAVFTGVFAAIYLVVWIVVMVCIKAVSRSLNKKLG